MKKLDKFFTNLAYDLNWGFDDPDINTDHPECPKCGAIMNFHGQDSSGRDYAQGYAYWECDSCGFNFDENTVRAYDLDEM